MISIIIMVGLVSLCSTNSTTGPSLAQIRKILRDSPGGREECRPPLSKRKWTRLSSEARAEVVQRYESGEPTTALAKSFKVSKSTILGILTTANVKMRRQPLTSKEVREATRLYEQGFSLSQIVDRMGLKQDTIRLALKVAGVKLRPPNGR